MHVEPHTDFCVCTYTCDGTRSAAGSIESMCRVCGECADRRYDSALHGDALAHALEVVANLLLVPGVQLGAEDVQKHRESNTHSAVPPDGAAKHSGGGIRARLCALAVKDASSDVRFQATRACVFAGLANVAGHCLLDVCGPTPV